MMVTIETPNETYLADVVDIEITHGISPGLEPEYPDEYILITDSELEEVGWP